MSTIETIRSVAVTDLPRDAARPKSGSNAGTASMAMVAVISLLAGVVGAAALQHYRPVEIPKLYVIDMGKSVRSIHDDTTLSAEEKREKAQRLGAEIKKWIDGEVAKGNVVLDKSAVLGAPQASYVDTGI